MKRIPYVNNEYYHIYNRGVAKRKVFLNKTDYERFLFILKDFNTTEVAGHTKRQIQIGRGSTSTNSNDSILVEVEEYCLMPNHFHLLLRQVRDGGISKFLQKVMTGYTMYFNTKYENDGVIFQGRHKSKHVDNEPYINWVRQYIHLNPLDLCIKNWKENGVPKSKIKKSIDFLNQYKWVSCDDYLSYLADINSWEQVVE